MCVDPRAVINERYERSGRAFKLGLVVNGTCLRFEHQMNMHERTCLNVKTSNDEYVHGCS